VNFTGLIKSFLATNNRQGFIKTTMKYTRNGSRHEHYEHIPCETNTSFVGVEKMNGRDWSSLDHRVCVCLFGGVRWGFHMGSLNKMSDIQWEFQDPKMEVLYHISTVFCGDIPLHRPYIGLIYGRHLQFRFLKWPLRYLCMTLRCLLIGTHRLVQDDADQVPGEQLNFVRTNVATCIAFMDKKSFH